MFLKKSVRGSTLADAPQDSASPREKFKSPPIIKFGWVGQEDLKNEVQKRSLSAQGPYMFRERNERLKSFE